MAPGPCGSRPSVPLWVPFQNDHQVRCVDLDRDGIDECVTAGYAIKGDGTVFWNMGSQGISHGDRWHIGAIGSQPVRRCWVGPLDSLLDITGPVITPRPAPYFKSLAAVSSDIIAGHVEDVDPTSPGTNAGDATVGYTI